VGRTTAKAAAPPAQTRNGHSEMKSATTQMKAHLASDCTTLTSLFLCVRADGFVVALTDHDRAITYTSTAGVKANSPVTYQPMDGLDRTADAASSDLSPDNLEVNAFLDSSAITEKDLRGKLYDAATIEIRLVNYADLTMGEIKLRSGTIGKVTMKNGLATAEVRGLTQQLSYIVGQVFGPTCRAELGDGRCKVPMPAYVQNGYVAAVISATEITPGSGLLQVGSATPTAPAPVGWFNDGVLTFTSGVNNGLSVQIKSWDGTNLTFTLPMFAQPEAGSYSTGDTFTILPGCNHSADGATGDCFNKFNNIINFRGENNIPGQDQIMTYEIPK
jgi:uncharacterized phage protein (TIGR02218 family)